MKKQAKKEIFTSLQTRYFQLEMDRVSFLANDDKKSAVEVEKRQEVLNKAHKAIEEINI